MFYNPFIGSKYKTDGFKGHKILVLGASLYCKITSCPFYKDCTDCEKKDSSAQEFCCPEYNKALLGENYLDLSGEEVRNRLSAINEKEITRLSDAPAIEDGRTYKRFANLLSERYYPGENIWERLSLTNYIQFILPTVNTKPGYMSSRDLDAFYEALDKTDAEIVIVWGCVVNGPLRELAIDKAQLNVNDGYLFHIEYKGRTITVVNPYHPSSTQFSLDQSKAAFINALNIALDSD